MSGDGRILWLRNSVTTTADAFGRPRLRGVPDSPEPKLRMGLVEHIYELATKNRVDVVLIEQKTRGTDLYQELERLTMEWPFALEYFSPTKSKEIRLEACVPLFTNERVWAPDKNWANGVISEVARPYVRLSMGRPVSQYAGNEGCAG